jgi:hypothetical protein
MPTPDLPSWIRGFTDPSCTNVYELLPDERKLYGTESLVGRDGRVEPTWRYGHWEDAELLLLAQDPSNVEVIRERRDGEATRGIPPHPDPFGAWDWRFDKHGSPQRDGGESNRNLHWLAQQIGCHKLYGSAFAGLLKHAKRRSGKTPGGPRVAQYKADILRWVVDPSRTPRLRAVACLGEKARDLVGSVLLNRDQRSQMSRGVGSSVRAGRLYVIHLMHPSPINHGRAGFGPQAWTLWRKLAVDCGLPVLAAPWEWRGPCT